MSTLTVTRHGDVAVLRMSDHENRFNLESLFTWHQTLGELEASDGPLAVVVTGTDKFFSNGLDLDRMSAHPDESAEIVGQVHQLLGRLYVLPAYTVAAINGHAFAGGAMLSCACDVRVMREDRGYWCLPEVDLGLPLTEAMFAAVTARLPRKAAHDSIMTGRRYTAAEAAALGIVEHTAAESDVLDRAIELAAVMAPKDRSVIATHKRMLFGEVATACGWVATD
jgi:enoyl-CoA hydratase/carnithine racemase